MQSSLKQHIPGILLALVIAACAYALGLVIPVVGGPVFGISLGIVVSTLWKPPVATRKGLKFTSKYILQLAVILLGFEMNLASIIQTGRNSLLVILITLSTAFLVAILVGRSLKLEPKLYTLIGVGTAICGGSAIAAASSAIDADDQDISYSISTIFLFNVIAVFLFPLAGHLLHLSDAGFGMWAGTAINDTSSVVAAGYAYSDAAGSFATIVKLTRSLMILPVTLALAMLFSRQNQEGGSFNLGRVFPWFILGFLAAAVLRSVGIIP
ncbi:MAG: putative sulfate exporter family transporter, partial [Chloroflexi bacterium]|nr:putative sulfate exporter family transporter [Chloroflexota bacterium]